MSGSHPNTFPETAQRDVARRRRQGEPGAEPPIDLDTMLDLTAAAEVDGIKFDGVDLFLFDPHINIDISDDDLKAVADKIAAKGFVVGSVVAPVWFDALGDGRRQAARELPDRDPQGLPDRQDAARAGRPALRRRADRFGVVARPTGPRIPTGNQKKIAETFKQAAAIARDHGERLAAEGEICWGGMHSWRTMVDLLERVGEPETVGFQADMAHTLLYTLGENAPEDRILPEDYDWKDRAHARRGPEDADRRAAALDDRLPRRPERRHRLRLRLARPHRPALPGDRPQRQARHPPPRRLLAPRRERQAHQEASATSAGTAACSPTPS